MVKRPIDSFVNYFLDVKPYHTKILEIVEQYLFYDDINVDIKENLFMTESWANEALCKSVGYGVDFDNPCGYSALSCCDLFECIGGYGLIYDNSDLLVSQNVTDITVRYPTTSDVLNNEYGLTIAGDYRFDTFIQIAETSGNNIIKVLGNVTAKLAPHLLFVIVPKNTYPIVETTVDGYYVFGNVKSQFQAVGEFSVLYSTANDNDYAVLEATYDIVSGRTFIRTYADNSLDTNATGSIIINSVTKNNGPYLRTDVSYDGTYTNIVVHDDTPLKLINELKHGSIVLRTAIVPGRRIWIDTTSIDTEYTEVIVSDTVYDLSTNSTTIYVQDAGNYATVNYYNTASLTDIKVDLRGYYFGAGFDGFQECSTPKPYHLYASISEYLQITEINYETAVPPIVLLYNNSEGFIAEPPFITGTVPNSILTSGRLFVAFASYTVGDSAKYALTLVDGAWSVNVDIINGLVNQPNVVAWADWEVISGVGYSPIGNPIDEAVVWQLVNPPVTP